VKEQVVNLNFEFEVDANWCRVYLPYTHSQSIINSQLGWMVCVTAIKVIPSKMVYNEQRNVDEKCDDVAGILPGKENANIKVRVVRM
jgi:hypothetical protein